MINIESTYVRCHSCFWAVTTLREPLHSYLSPPHFLHPHIPSFFNPLNAELNPICHLLALLGGATIIVVSRLRVNESLWTTYSHLFFFKV